MRLFSQSGRALVALAFLTFVPLVAHLLYSAMGFNPAHDGTVLSAARRLLEGQVPHRDFIYLRPVLSPLLHVPIVWLGGQQVIWLSRLFIWFQLAVIAWVWVALMNRLMKNCLHVLELVALACLGLVFSATSFPAIASHVLSGVCLAILGLALCLREKSTLKMGGYFLCGCAVLCKPSFFVVALLVLLTTADWRRMKYWLAAALPGMLYVVFLSFTDALYDALPQMVPWTMIGLSLTLRRFWFGIFMAFGYFAMRWIYGTPLFALTPARRRFQVALGWLVIGVVPLFMDFKQMFNGVLDEATLNLFWTIAGAGVYFIMETTNDRAQSFGRLASWAVALAWAAAVSRFSISMAICGGILLTLLLTMSLTVIPSVIARIVVLIILAGAALFSFNHGRQLMVTEEVPTAHLTYPLDGMYPGAEGIYSSTNTYLFAADLQKAVAKAGQWSRPYAIIPDCPGYWAAAAQKNPLPMDSLREIEYYNVNLLTSIMEMMDSQRPNLTILVQKVDANRLYSGDFVKIEGYRWNAKIVRDVRKSFKKIGETEFFELYE